MPREVGAGVGQEYGIEESHTPVKQCTLSHTLGACIVVRTAPVPNYIVAPQKLLANVS